MYSKTKKAVCLLGVTALITTGCADISLTGSISKNGALKTETTILAEKTATDEYFQEMVGTSFVKLNTVLPGVETIEQNGKTYYSFKDTENTTIQGLYNQKVDGEKIIEESIATSGITYNCSETCLNMNGKALSTQIASDKEMSEAYNAMLKEMTMNYTITFPYKVTKTNGTLSEDGYTVTFNDTQCKSNNIYAYTEKNYSLSGITEGGISSKNKLTFAKDISVKEGTKTIANGATLSDGTHLLVTKRGDVQKTIYTIVDTKAPVFYYIKNKKYYKTSVFGTATDKTTAVSSITIDKKKSSDSYISVSKNGKHTVVAKDLAGNTAKCIFYIDKKKPAVKGVKNGKTYKKSVKVKCKDNMKLKSVKVNGKKKKASFTLKKKGKYTIIAQDKAGNKTKVKIKIK